VTGVEERLSDLLHQALPETAEVSFDAVASRVRRRRRASIAAVVASVMAVAGAGTATYLTVHSGGGGAAETLTSVNTGNFHGIPVPLAQSTIIVDPGAHETFSPPSAHQLRYGPTLTAAQALVRFKARSGSKHLPVSASVTVQLGSLTLAGQAANTLAYGYRGARALCRGGSSVNTAAATILPGQCAPWTFLDANTGRWLDSVMGQSGPGGPVVIDSSVNEVFTPTPLPAGVTAVSAQSTWDLHNGTTNQPLPNGVTAQYGTLTLPKSSPNAAVQSYDYKDQPVWAYSKPGGCDPGFGLKPLPTPPGGVCISWTFLDATTAYQLDETQEQ
jgi:hypothetical protein